MKPFSVLPWIYSANFAIFAGEEDLGAVPVPAPRVDEVGQRERDQGLSGADVPYDHIVVRP